MGFQLVPKLVTLNDLEWRNGSIVCIFFAQFGSFCAYYVKVVEDTPTHSGSEM